LLVNTSLLNPGNAMTGFDGIACVGGGPRILPGADNGTNGDKVPSDGRRELPGVIGAANTVAPGFVLPGGTYYVQYWYRDVLCGPAPCVTPCTTPPPGAANFTNAASFVATP
jgi:hypothetical protein